MDPYLGEIRMFAGNFAPQGWALCNGQTLSIQQYTALFSLLGTTYGGNGQTTFQLPNLQGTVPLHWGTAPSGTNYVIGQVGGSETVTLNSSQMPLHNHTVQANAAASTGNVSGAVPAPVTPPRGSQQPPPTLYAAAPDGSTKMNASMLANAGGSQPHNNLQPYLCVTFIIALQGIYPTRS